MNTKYKIIVLGLVLSFQAMSAEVPQSWINDSEDISIEKSDEISELEKSYDNILEAKSDFIEEVNKGKPDNNKKWYLQSIATYLAIEKKGTLGVLGMGGETSVGLIWQRNKDSLKKLQEKYYGKSTDGVEKSLDSETSTNGETVVINSNTSKVEMERQLEPLVEAAFVAGKVKNKKHFKERLLSRLSEYQNLLNDLDSAPQFTPWWIYKFQFELVVEAEGEVLPFMAVGAQVRLKVEWYRIQKKVNDKSLGEPSKNAKTLMAMASDFAAMDELALGQNKDKRFVLDTIKAGIGITAEGEMVMAKVKGKVFGSVFFKREKISDKSLGELPVLPSTIPVMDKATDENLSYAKTKNIKVKSMDKSLEGGAVYLAHRDYFRKGLKKAVKMAKFWSKGALRRQERRIAQGKQVDFDLNVIELELELFLSGGIGVATVEGAAELELFLVKK